MPGETRNYTFMLPVAVADIDSIDIMFYQNGEKIFKYDETMTDRIYGIQNEPNILVCSIPREDTLKFENNVKAEMQMEWDVDGYYSVAKPLRISVGTYLGKEYAEV